MGYNVRRKTAFYVFLSIILFSSVFAASADFNSTMDSILLEENISYGSASYALLYGTDVIDEYFTPMEAASVMAEKYPETKKNWDSPVCLGEFSNMIMQVYGIKGGLMYRLFHNPRYAVRELRYRNILQDKSFGGQPVSGEQALIIIGRVLEKEEAADE